MANFDTYRVYHHSQVGTTAKVECYDLEKLVAILEFYPDGIALPKNETKNNVGYIRFPARDLSDIMNTLRHEKPLFVTQAGAIGYVGSHPEPVGEQEAV